MDINSENSNKKRLGRGLGSLLGGSGAQGLADFGGEKTPAKSESINKNKIVSSKDVSVENNKEIKVQTAVTQQEQSIENKIWFIGIDKLVPGVYQPRKNFNKESMQELADSIKQNGILQPIAIRKRQAGGFEIIAGERRWRAAQIAGLHEVPAILKQVSDKEALQLALIENIQREDLDPIEEAESYQRLIQEFNLSQLEAAEKVGKERSTVANALRLLQLPKEIKEMISTKEISTGHAKVLLSIADKNKQVQVAKQVFEKSLSVRALEALIKSFSKTINDEKPTETKSISEKLVSDLADQLQKNLGTKVEISYKLGKGQINIQFYSDEQLTNIYEKIKA